MFASAKRILTSGLLIASASLGAADVPPIGRVATPEEIAGWDIDIRPDGAGLPTGSATVIDGEDLYIERCASCHGEFGEAVGRYPVLMGGHDSLTSDHPVKTVGSYWPYASTVFDYVRRAMPFGHAQSLSADETYALTGYLLYLNDLVDEEQVVDADFVASFEMPNRDGFIRDSREDEPAAEPCMSNCRAPPKLLGRARIVDVTPAQPETTESAPAESAVNLSAAAEDGKRLFAMCGACHSTAPDEHGIGPSLAGIAGREAGATAGFERYSEAMRSAGFEWTDESLGAFLRQPQATVAGTNMPFAGLSDEAQIDALVAYLLTL